MELNPRVRNDCPPLRVVALLFPRISQLDLTGLVEVLAALPGVAIDLAWKDLQPVSTGSGFDIVPTTTFVNTDQADVLLIPGGPGAFDLLNDETVLAFVREQAARAQYVVSVCTGAFLLGAAGLLDGLRATTHWAFLDLLPRLGAIAVSERVVQDGRVITGAGVSSGIDLALTLVALLADEAAAKRIQLLIEYDPEPPFDAGSLMRPGTDLDKALEWRDRMRARRVPLVAAVAATRRADERERGARPR